MPLPAHQKYPAFPVWIHDESDWDHSAGYSAWCHAADKPRLERAAAALAAAGFEFDLQIGAYLEAGPQTAPNHVSRRPTSAAAIIRRAIAPYLEDADAPTRADLARTLAPFGFRLIGDRVEG